MDRQNNGGKTKKEFLIGQCYRSPECSIQLQKAITTRRTVRRYQEKLVPEEKLEELLRLSTHAPSACNRRGWRFILVSEKQSLEWIFKKGGAAFIPKAKQAILVCYFRHSDNAEWADVEQSAAAAIAYFQLLAHSEGIGSCWICHLPKKSEIAGYFKIPINFMPMALLTVGYYPEKMKVLERELDDEEILSKEKWTFTNVPGKDTVGLKLFFRKLLRKLYYLFPKREWIRQYTCKFEKKFDNEKHYEE